MKARCRVVNRSGDWVEKVRDGIEVRGECRGSARVGGVELDRGLYLDGGGHGCGGVWAVMKEESQLERREFWGIGN